MHLGTPAVAILMGVTSVSVSPAPLPCPGSGLATPLASPARGSDRQFLLDHAKPERSHAWGCSLPLAAFQVGMKPTGCFPGDELGYALGPLQ